MSDLHVQYGKLEVTGQIGEHFDKAHEHAIAETYRRNGAKTWLKRAAKESLESVLARVKQDREAGKLDLSNFETELQVESLINSYLIKVGECLNNLSAKAESEELVAGGRAAAMRDAAQTIQRYHNASKARVDQITAAQKAQAEEAVGDAGPRVPGTHPGPSSLDERREEARAKAEPMPLQEVEPEKPAEGEKPKKRKNVRRKKKKDEEEK